MALKELKLDELTDHLLSRYPEHSELISRAIDLVVERHGDQKRASGEPYVLHPLSVAKILSELNMDPATVTAGILHDILEDTETTYRELEQLFGREVADIVEGVTKIGKIRFRNLREAQAENFRKLILATARDIRVVIVKLADRLHNMRTLSHLRREKRIRIAEETLTIYAPIAHRLGIWEVKRDLEDLSFKYLYPREYERVRAFVSQSASDMENYLKKFVIPKVLEAIREAGIKVEVSYRPKHFYSIWQKTLRKNIRLEDVHDLLGVRIVVGSVQECYTVLGIVHSLYKPVPGKFKDYISLPKPNLYQSLHTTVVADKGKLVEFQIRTEEMHLRAERGIAAHWMYKEGSGDEKEGHLFSWLRDLVDNIKGSKNPGELLDSIRRDLFSEEVFVFTPKGDLLVLPAGSTPVDFAYHIHTEVGDHCVGCKVNGRIVPLSYRLRNGDRVEIMTSPSQKPNPEWLKFVATSKAKNRIKHHIKRSMREKFLEEGERILDRMRESLKLSREELMERISRRVRFSTEEELIIALGSGKLSPSKILSLIQPKKKGPKDRKQVVKSGGEVLIDGIDNLKYEVARCCMPVPGDEVYGVVRSGKGIVLHEKGCSNLRYLAENFPEKVLKIRWKPEGRFKTRVRVSVRDRIGVLSEVTSRISQSNANILESYTRSLGEGTAVMDFTIDVEDRKHLQDVIRHIKEVEGVKSCKRLYA